MGVITRIALRNMKRRKTRYILTTFTLVIGVALFGGIMIASDSFYGLMLSSIDQQMGTSDILVRSDKNSDGWFDPDDIEDTIRDVDHVEEVSFRISGFRAFVSEVKDDGNKVDNSTYASIYGIDIDDDDEDALGGTPYILDAIKKVEGSTTVEELLDYEDDETGNRVIVVTESLKIKLGKDIDAGDTIQILPNDFDDSVYIESDTGTWLTYTIAAVIRDSGEAQDFDPDDPSEHSSPSQEGPLLFTNLKNAREIADGQNEHKNEVNLCVIGLDDMYNAEVATEDIKKDLDDLKDGMKWEASDLKTSELEDVDNTMITMRAMFMMFGLIALILSIVLITNVFNIIREEQEYETGMFQAIGASKSETFKMFIIQGVVMGTIGAVIGTILSYFISYWIFDSVISTLQTISENAGGGMGFAPSEFEIVLEPITLIATFCVGFVSCMIASIYPSYKASKKPLIECLNPIEEKSEREKKRYIKTFLYAALGIFLILYSSMMLLGLMTGSNAGGAGHPGGPGGDTGDNVIAMTAPTFMLLGIIILTALLVRPLSKGLIVLFKPYLKQTRLLTEKNILRHRKRTVLTYAMIALTVSYLVGMSVSMDSMREGVNTTVDDFMGSDARVFAYGTPRSLEDDLMDIDGVEDVMGVRYQSAQVKVDGDWIGHSQLDDDYDESVNINVIDPEKVKEHMKETIIISPNDMNLEEMLDEIESGKNIVVTEEFANDNDVEVGDKLPVKFSLGVTYSSLQAKLTFDDSDVKEETVTVNMEVVAIVKKIQGFFTGSAGFGSSSVTMYAMFISWDTFEKEVAPYELPGEGTDLIYRQLTETGDPMLDAVQSNWFNFSTVEAIMNGIDGIDYYTTRMDYSTSTFGTALNYMTPVVGVHTDSNGNIVSDSYFGSNSIEEKNNTYAGSTLEELLDTTDDVCVVDETFADDQNVGIGSEIAIYPLDTDPIQGLTRFGNINTSILEINGSLFGGNLDDLMISDNVNLTYISNNSNLILDLSLNVTTLLAMSPKPVNLTFESRVNASVDNLKLQALNLYTMNYDTLGDINNILEKNNTLEFNPNGLYINSTTGLIKLKIIGQNSTADANFTLDIDNMMLNYTKSKFNATDPLTWPTFEVVGIINTPKLYETERYEWFAGMESGADASGNAVYINYDKARNIVYPDYNGSDYSNDKVTSVLVHCENPEDIASIRTELTQSLIGAGGLWTIADLKSDSLDFRKSVFDWYFWFEEGTDDEEVLEEIQLFIQDEGYLIMFGFTKTFMMSTFISMINLISSIFYGMLILAIIISLIGLALHSLLTTMSRRREIGMLRSIGLSKKGIVRSISGETLIISLLGVLIGIGAGLIQGTLMVLATPEGGFITYTLVFPWVTIGILVGITVVAAILSSLFPARWAANLNIIDAVRTR